MDATRQSGKVAVVTGAGSGIGLATAIRLAREGATVVGCDVAAAAIDSATTAAAEAGVEVRLVVADVTAQGDVDRLVADVGTPIDILCNVAGIMDHFLPLHEVDDATWNRVMNVNVTGVMRLTRAVLPQMREQGKGAIVTVASEASLGGGAAGTAYTTSKHGVLGLVRSAAFYYGREGIRSNAVLPGPVATGIGATAAPRSTWAMELARAKMATIVRMAEPDELAALISWLASDEASNVNGAIVTCDGGWSAA